SDADCIGQFAARIDDELTKDVDALVAAGVVRSRSDAVRLGLVALVDAHRRRLDGDEIARGYTTVPQTEHELAGLDAATRALIAEMVIVPRQGEVWWAVTEGTASSSSLESFSGSVARR
ncbi:MAG: ribbon-helix-helix domain-containing protein, partial [Actinobacteria bacterium]|nr:ribbon-helix-helix domain-containing protein [Actinomycetota bacterium]